MQAKNRVVILLCIIIQAGWLHGGVDCCDCNNDSHSVYIPREITTNNVYENNLSLYWWYRTLQCKEEKPWLAAWITPFFQRTTREVNLTKYFLPHEKETITVEQDGLGDIGSIWFNLLAAPGHSFNRMVSMHPQRNVTGVYFNFRADLSTYICNTWMSVAFAAMKSRQNLNFCEIIPNPYDPSPGVIDGLTSVACAVNQPGWLYGKMSLKPLGRGGVDDVEFKIGYDAYLNGTDNHISPYFVVVAPTGKGTCPEFIFEPIVGSNHTNIGAGFIADYLFINWHDISVVLLMDFKYRYVLSGCEKRTFDLCNGDWSRYLIVVEEGNCNSMSAGNNLFTRDVRVTRKSVIDWLNIMHIQWGNWSLETGYDFWWRQAEKIEVCNLPAGFGIYEPAQICITNPITASQATICQSIVNNVPTPDANFVELTVSDLNLRSGATPRAYSNTFFAAFGYQGCVCDLPLLMGLGGMMEWGETVRIASNWAVWARVGIAF